MKRLSEKGSEKHIYAERIVFDTLWKFKDVLIERDIKPFKFKSDCK